MKESTIAELLIKDGPNLSEGTRRDIALWLRRQANFLMRHPDKLSKRFRARVMQTGNWQSD